MFRLEGGESFAFLLPSPVGVLLHEVDYLEFALAVDSTAEVNNVIQIEDQKVCGEPDEDGDYDKKFETKGCVVDTPDRL